jgi:hypothetical protein
MHNEMGTVANSDVLGSQALYRLHHTAKIITALNHANDHEVKREWRFDSAFIYYWMEVPCFTCPKIQAVVTSDNDSVESLFKMNGIKHASCLTLLCLVIKKL